MHVVLQGNQRDITVPGARMSDASNKNCRFNYFDVIAGCEKCRPASVLHSFRGRDCDFKDGCVVLNGLTTKLSENMG